MLREARVCHLYLLQPCGPAPSAEVFYRLCGCESPSRLSPASSHLVWVAILWSMIIFKLVYDIVGSSRGAHGMGFSFEFLRHFWEWSCTCLILCPTWTLMFDGFSMNLDEGCIQKDRVCILASRNLMDVCGFPAMNLLAGKILEASNERFINIAWRILQVIAPKLPTNHGMGLTLATLFGTQFRHSFQPVMLLCGPVTWGFLTSYLSVATKPAWVNIQVRSFRISSLDHDQTTLIFLGWLCRQPEFLAKHKNRGNPFTIAVIKRG